MKKEEVAVLSEKGKPGAAQSLDDFLKRFIDPKKVPKGKLDVDDWVPVPKQPTPAHKWDKKKGKWYLPKPEKPPVVKPEKPPVVKPERKTEPAPQTEPKIPPPNVPNVRPKVEPAVPKPERKPQPKPEPRTQKITPKVQPRVKVEPKIEPVPKVDTPKVKPITPAKPTLPGGKPIAKATAPAPKTKIRIPKAVLKPTTGATTGTKNDIYAYLDKMGEPMAWDKPLREQQGYTKEQYADLVRKYSKQYGVPESLALHVLNRETGIYDPNKAAKIKSRAGAVGPMQLLPRYAKDFGIEQRDLTNPVKNIEAGVRNLAKNYYRFSENPEHALMAYNWGPTATANWLTKGGKGKIPQETRDYIYGSKEKGWAPYKDDVTQQINAYLGTDAQSYIEKRKLDSVPMQIPAPQPDTRKLDPQQMATDVKQGFDTIAQTAQDYAKKGYDYVAPIAKDLGKKTSDYLNKKWQNFKTDAMATDSGTDTAAIAGAGDTGELPNVTRPRSPGAPPEIKGGPIVDKAKALGTAALDKASELNKSTKIVDKLKQKYLDFTGQNKTTEPVKEKAPPGDKYERMVKDIKKGYAKDGKLTDTERGIAYATAWKLYNKRKGKKS